MARVLLHTSKVTFSCYGVHDEVDKEICRNSGRMVMKRWRLRSWLQSAEQPLAAVKEVRVRQMVEENQEYGKQRTSRRLNHCEVVR
jgi:hypothetical protein